MPNDMIERVAKGIQNEAGIHLMGYGLAVNLAKAAIAAMREPSDRMLEPVTNADGFLKISDPVQAWRAMIDAALKE